MIEKSNPCVSKIHNVKLYMKHDSKFIKCFSTERRKVRGMFQAPASYPRYLWGKNLAETKFDLATAVINRIIFN
jgi:hypothetical protein